MTFPTPPDPTRSSGPQTAAEAAADLHPIFRGEVPMQSPIVGMTSGGPSSGGNGQHVAPMPEVPGMNDGQSGIPSAIMDTRATGTEGAGALAGGIHTAPLPDVPGVTT